MEAFRGILGILAFVGVAWFLSENKRAVSWKLILAGIGIQFLIAFFFKNFPGMHHLFFALNQVVLAIDEATKSGSSFIFGYLGGAPLPFEEAGAGTSFVIAFQVLPIVLVMSALSSLLFHYGILQKIVEGFAYFLKKTMKAEGAVGLGVASNLFLGIIEAPLFIRPYLSKMTRSGLFTIMVAGMSTVAGTVMVIYAKTIAPVVSDAAGQILVASVMSLPAAILIAHTMVPGVEKKIPRVVLKRTTENGFDAIIKGTMDGIQMVLAIAAMIIVLFALISLVNQVLGLFSFGVGEPLSVQSIFGFLFAPFCWLMGIPWEEAIHAGRLMGTKTVLNEFVAYLDFAKPENESLSERTRMILTYSMCGFANFGSLGIIVGGMSTMIPKRRKEIVQLAFKSVLAGTLSTMMTGAVVSLF